MNVSTAANDLPEERIGAIRSRVMYQVDTDITQRRRRVRKTLVGGAGALALIAVLGVAMPSLTGIHQNGAAAGSADMAMPEPATGEMARSQADAATSSVAQDSFAAKQAAPDIAPVPPGGPTGPLTAPGDDREVITTGRASVVVKNPSDRADRFTRWTQQHGGRVDARSENRDDEGHTSADLTARIPSKQVAAAITELRTYGTVQSVSLQRDDVTAQGQDLDARIKALKISVARLEAILEKAGSSSQVIEAETALSERQQELDSLQLQRRSLDDQVSLSTLSVSFTQESKPGAVAPGGFRGGLVSGWNALVDTVNAIVTAAGAVLPWLGLVALGGLLWWSIRRGRRRN